MNFEVITSNWPASTCYWYIHRGGDKCLASHIFLFAAQPKEFFLVGLKNNEVKCVELREEYVE